MNVMPNTFDPLLSIALILLTLFSLRARDLFHAIVLYMMFGLLVAVTWLRLHAPDIALAEVAIGTGITGALFLGALGRMESSEKADPAASGSSRRGLLLTGLTLALGAVLVAIVIRLDEPRGGLGVAVGAQLDSSGVKNPVTAVVLNFRGYDTILEIGVLLFALLGAHTVQCTRGGRDERLLLPPDNMLVMFVHLIAPMLILTAGYLVWVGDHAPGGAFQAGALLGGVGVIVLLASVKLPLDIERGVVRAAAALGFATFLGTGLALMTAGAFLQFPPTHAKPLMLAIELACAISIGVTLASLFAACANLLHPGEPPQIRDGEVR